MALHHTKKAFRSCFSWFFLISQNTALPPISLNASTYLNSALDLMEHYGLRRHMVDWPSLRKRVMEYANGAQSVEETYPALTLACVQKDNVCNLQLPIRTSAVIWNQCLAIQTAAANKHGRPLLNNSISPLIDRDRFSLSLLHSATLSVAYVVIPMASGAGADYNDPKLRHEWAERLLHVVSTATQMGSKAWILDIRGVRRGYLAPMLAGLAPLLSDGTLLHFRSPTSKYVMGLAKGKVYTQVGRSSPYTEEILDDLVDLHQETAPVVFLVDQSTEGAAEELAIAFKGRARTLFVGQHTAGYSAGGFVWPLVDGATLTAATATVSDRKGIFYEEGLAPDISVPSPQARVVPAQDPAVLAALLWLATQHSL